MKTAVGLARAMIERLSGRTVTAFISNYHVGPDLAVELFLLAPGR